MRTPEMVPTMDEARAQVAERWTRDGTLDREARQIIAGPQRRNAELARERATAERIEHENRELATQAAKVWRQEFGRAIARQLEPFRTYWILRLGQLDYAFSEPESLDSVRAVLDGGDVAHEVLGVNGRKVRDLATSEGTPGVFLTRVTTDLEAVEPALGDFEAMVSEVVTARQTERLQAAQRAADERRQRREKQLFGVVERHEDA